MNYSLRILWFAIFALGTSTSFGKGASANPIPQDPCLLFSLYSIADIYQGPFVKPRLDMPEQVRRFRTAIREDAEGAPNFAGRFRVVHWGCGANCHAYALVDKMSGKVHVVPQTAALGASFHVESALFVIDPPEMIKESGSPLFATISTVWDEKSASLVALPGCGGEPRR